LGRTKKRLNWQFQKQNHTKIGKKKKLSYFSLISCLMFKTSNRLKENWLDRFQDCR
jgi:hypothetical protein